MDYGRSGNDIGFIITENIRFILSLPQFHILHQTKGDKPLREHCKVENYSRELAECERKIKENRRPAVKERYVPPEKKSVRGQHRRLQAEGRQQKPKRKSYDRER